MTHNFENTESWEDMAGNTYKLGNSRLVSPHLFIFAPHFSAFAINKPQSLPFWKFQTNPFKKCLLVGFLNLFTFMFLWESMKPETTTKVI